MGETSAMKIKNLYTTVLLWIVLLIAAYYYIDGRISWAATGVIIAGVLGIWFKRIGAEVLLLAGIMFLLWAYDQRLLFIVFGLFTVVVGVFDLIQLIRIASANVSSGRELICSFRNKEFFRVVFKQLTRSK